MNSSIWEHFASGSFSPSTSPAFLSGPGAAEMARLRQELDEANGTIKQWEESWKQAKQVLGQIRGLGSVKEHWVSAFQQLDLDMEVMDSCRFYGFSAFFPLSWKSPNLWAWCVQMLEVQGQMSQQMPWSV